MAVEVTGEPWQAWLAMHRAALNQRFRQAKRKYPQLDDAAVLALLPEILAPLAVDASQATSELLHTVYDLILLHAGRGLLGNSAAPLGPSQAGALTPSIRPTTAITAARIDPHPHTPRAGVLSMLSSLMGGRNAASGVSESLHDETASAAGTFAPADIAPLETPIGFLLRRVFPELRAKLVARPKFLPGALSNAVEQLGPLGLEFAAVLPALASAVRDPQMLLDAGAVVAWRLGEARLRSAALQTLETLPAEAALAALGLSQWPPEAAALVAESLRLDGWSHPHELFLPETLASLVGSTAQKWASVRKKLVERIGERTKTWHMTAMVGEFSGFGGVFPLPPILVAGAPHERHRFWLASAGQVYRVDADCFGYVCRLDPSQTGSKASQSGAKPREHALLARATSNWRTDDMIACTLADSHRLRILTPERKPL